MQRPSTYFSDFLFQLDFSWLILWIPKIDRFWISSRIFGNESNETFSGNVFGSTVLANANNYLLNKLSIFLDHNLERFTGNLESVTLFGIFSVLFHVQLHWQFLIIDSSFWWSIFCRGNLIFCQKRNENYKTLFFVEKQQQNVKKYYVNIK